MSINKHKFLAEQLKIYKVSIHEPLSKVVDHWKPSNFAFGRFSSSKEKFGEKLNQSSIEIQRLNWISEVQKLPNVQSLVIQNPLQTGQNLKYQTCSPIFYLQVCF